MEEAVDIRGGSQHGGCYIHWLQRLQRKGEEEDPLWNECETVALRATLARGRERGLGPPSQRAVKGQEHDYTSRPVSSQPASRTSGALPRRPKSGASEE